jgi:glycosyltransferase involved in cell wall biosynthesis
MRYIWDLYYGYLNNASPFIKMLFPIFAHYLRNVDVLSANRVDFFIANSSFVSSRIKKFYRRSAHVIHPPVDVSRFSPSMIRKNYFLYFGELVAYKRVDIAIEAFNILGLDLIIAGDGEERANLEKMAKENKKFIGRLDDSDSRYYLETCRALIFPGLEDFGIVPVEAMSAGAPVIAYGKGGVLDTVIDGVTGILFEGQSKESLIGAITRFESSSDLFSSEEIHKHARSFNIEVFKKNIRQFIKNAIN